MKDWPSPSDQDEPEWVLKLEFGIVVTLVTCGTIMMIYFTIGAVAALT